MGQASRLKYQPTVATEPKIKGRFVNRPYKISSYAQLLVFTQSTILGQALSLEIAALRSQ